MCTEPVLNTRCNSTAGVTLVGFSADRSHLFMGVSTAGMTVSKLPRG